MNGQSILKSYNIIEMLTEYVKSLFRVIAYGLKDHSNVIEEIRETVDDDRRYLEKMNSLAHQRLDVMVDSTNLIYNKAERLEALVDSMGKQLLKLESELKKREREVKSEDDNPAQNQKKQRKV